MRLAMIILTIIFGFSFAEAKEMFVINSNSKTLSRINLETFAVNNTFAAIGNMGYGMALHGDNLYLVDSTDNNITVISSLNGNKLGEVWLPESNPMALTIHNDYVYVTGWESKYLFRIHIDKISNTNPNPHLEMLEVGDGPEHMFVTGNKMYVSLTAYESEVVIGDGYVAVVNLETFTLIGHIPVGMNPASMIMDTRGYVHVLSRGNYYDIKSNIVTFDSATREIKKTTELDASYYSIQYGPGGLAYIAHSWTVGFIAYDPLTYNVIGREWDFIEDTNGGDIFGYDLTYCDKYIYTITAAYGPSGLGSQLCIYSHNFEPVNKLTLAYGSTSMVIKYPPPSQKDHDLVAENLTGTETLPVSQLAEFNFTVKNAGLNDAEDFAIKLMQFIEGGNDVEIDKIENLTLKAGKKEDFYFTWSPMTADTFKLYAVIVYEEDENPENNKSSIHTIVVESGQSVLPPTNVVALINDYELVISWNAPNNEESYSIVYNVFRALDVATKEWVNVASDITATTCKDSVWDDLVDGNYVYSVIAVYNIDDTEVLSDRAVSEPIKKGDPDKESDNIIIPANATLYANYPNPFNPTTTIKFVISGGRLTEQEAPLFHINNIPVTIDIFNIKGQKICNLVNGTFSAGEYNVVWNGKDDNGVSVGCGIYFYRMNTAGFSATKKMVLIK